MKSTLLQRASVHRRWAFAPLESVTTPSCSQVKTLVRTTSTLMSFNEMVSDSLCRNFSVVQTQLRQLSGWLVSDDPAGEEARCGCHDWRGDTWSAVVRPIGHTGQILNNDVGGGL